MPEFPQAEEVWLRKLKRITPKFHQHIAFSKMKKEPFAAGDEIAGYVVERTVPEGKLIASEQTAVHYD